MKKIFAFFCILLCLGFFACMHTVDMTGRIFETVSVGEFSNLIESNQNNPNFVLIDVRTADEFAGGHIKGAQNIDFKSADFESQMNLLDKDKTHLIYCQSGRRSEGAFNKMRELGFKTVYQLSGGIVSWKSAGYKVE